MKKLIIISMLSSIALLGSVSVFGNGEKPSPEACKYGQCTKTKSDGYQCGNCAQQNSWYCWSHNN